MKDITEIIPFGDQEPEMSKQTKQLYVKVQHNNPLKKINFKEFILKIKEYIEIYDFDWQCKHSNGRKCYPRYDKKECAKDWPKRYDYRGAYRTYARYMNGEDETDLLLLEKTLRDNDIRTLFAIAHSIFEDIQNYQQNNDDGKYAYKLKALLESYKLIMDEIRARLELETETETTSNIIPVSDNPAHEIDEINDYWDSLMWKEIGEEKPW